ncbi:uncharacterized protein LOC143218905 [Lasioglossum baleicum]|uniref:uncharacterized protein LOC143218905 n=1 Tax=Lasioglossum baleicum TaxID=434251 RepID=UPI003FCD6C0A
MADDDEEFLDVEDPDSPGSPVNSESVQAVEGSKTGSKSPSLKSGNDRSPDKSVSEIPGPEEPKAGSITSGSIKSNGPGSKKSRDSVEETSKSHEVIRRSQELPLSGKQSSLDRLSEKKDTGQRTKISKWQRQCNRQFRDIIGKREMKNEELERQQGDLRQRLNILECSMPAVMVWNIWRMTQGDNAPCLQEVLEKQFQGPASGEVYCPTSPSRHFDCRVREAEAERKQAQNRIDEARSLWAEKMASLEDREKRLQEARKLQEEQQRRIEQLTTEVQKLREARSTEDEGACEAGECGVIECRKKWLEKVPSSASIRSTDIECLEKLHELAEAELCMKRQIGDLERREQAYMRTLQQADELWNCLEGGAAAGTIQEQLETKTERITELEEELQYLRSKMATCREELEKHMSIGKIEALIGRDDDFASVRDTEAVAAVSMRDEISGRGDEDDEIDRMTSKLSAIKDALGKYISAEELEAIVGVDEKDISSKLSAYTDALAKYVSVEELEAIEGGDDEIDRMTSQMSAYKDALGKYISAEELKAIVGDDAKDMSSKLSAIKDALGKYISAEELEAIAGKDVESAADGTAKGIGYKRMRPEGVDVEESTVMDAQKLLAQIGSLSELDGPGTFCAPDFDCNDLGLSGTGLPEEERIALEEDRVTARELLEKYGLLEIAEQMGATIPGGVIQYKMARKYEVERTEYVGAKETRSEVEEVVEREIAYDEEAREHDGVKEDEVREQEDDVGVEEDEVGIQEDEVGIQEDEVGIQEDEVGMQEDEVRVQEDEVGIQEDEIGMQKDEVRVQKDEVGIQEDEVGLMRDEVEEKRSVPSKKAEGVLVPMDQLSSWQDRVHAVRSKISECPSCDTMDREAKIVADELAAYTGRTTKLEARERIAKGKESIEIEEETMEFAEEEDEMKFDRREDDTVEFVKVDVKVEDDKVESVKVDVKVEERIKREPVDEVEPVERERELKPEPEEPVVVARTPEDVPKETRKEPEEVKEKVPVSAAEIKSERPAVVDEVKPAEKEKVVEEDKETNKEEVTEEEKAVAKEERVPEVKLKEEAPLEKKDAEEVPEIATVKEQVEDKELGRKEPEPAVKEELEEVPEKKPEIKVKEEEIEPEETVSEKDEVEEVPVERLEEFEVAVEVDIIPVEEEPEPEEKEIVPTEIEVDVDLVKEEPIEEIEVPEEIAPLKEEPKPEEGGIIPEEEGIIPEEEGIIPEEEGVIPEEEGIIPEEEGVIPEEEGVIPEEEGVIPEEEGIIPEEEGIIPKEIEVEEIPVEVVAELKPEEIVLDEEEIQVDVIPKEEPLRPEEETIVEIPVEEAEEEIKAEVPELERIELEVKVLEDAKVAEVDVEIEIIAPVEVLKEKDEEVPEEPEVLEISVDEECTCDEFYDVEYLLPPVTEEVEEEESVCQCMVPDYPPEDAEKPGECQCSTEDIPDGIEESAECQCMKDLQDQAEVTPVEKEDSGVCKCTSKAPSEEKPPSVKKEDSGVCKCTSKAPSEEKPPSIKKEDSGVCKCKSKTPSEEKPPSVKKEDSGVCKCTSKAPSEEKPPSVKKEDSGVCKCTSKTPSEEKPPSVKKEDSGVCKCTSKAPSKEKTPSVRKGDSGVCKCILQPPVKDTPTDPTRKMHTRRDQSGLPPTTSQVVYQKMEITQTSITQFEAQKTTIQAVTQTVADVGMQAQPPPKLLRQQPRGTDAENLERLTRWKRSQNPAGAAMVGVTSQTEKSSFLRILQTLKTSGVYSKLEPEKELRTIHYGKKSDDAEGRCNCCLCGKTVQDTPPGPKTVASTLPGASTSSVVKLLQALPLMSKTGPGVDQGVQHESLCKECNVKGLQRSAKPQGPSTMEPKQVQTTNDQAVSVSKPSLKELVCSKPKKPGPPTMTMIKVQKSGRRKPPSEKTSALKSQPEHKSEERKEDEDLMECICSSMGTGVKKIRCACGDPD